MSKVVVLVIVIIVGLALLTYWGVYQQKKFTGEASHIDTLESLVVEEIFDESPWLKQLRKSHTVQSFDHDQKTDIVIVGGGIAGAATAYYLLTRTQKQVVLLEAATIASGATGHNAGQIASYFERPLTSLIDEFGVDLALDAQASIESAWDILHEIHSEAHIRVPFYTFVGYDGYTTIDAVKEVLQQNKFRIQKKLPPKKIYVVDDPAVIEALRDFEGSYTLLSRERINMLLETEQPLLIAAVGQQTGCMNSAVFTYELIGYLAQTYPDRFTFYEHSPVSEIELQPGNVHVHVNAHQLAAERVVLCTNGFAGFTFSGEQGSLISDKFAHQVSGRIGYMIGYLDAPSLHQYPVELHPYTVRYHTSFAQSHLPSMPLSNYFYLTHWPFHVSEPDDMSLVCVGGPEEEAPASARQAPLPSLCVADVKWVIHDFLKIYYRHYNIKQRKSFFCWRGLMGYTRSMIRLVGPEPLHPALLYNLGCNGVGILPSLFGAAKIADYCLGKSFKPSLFDPQ